MTVAQTLNDDLGASMAMNRRSSASVAMMNASYSYGSEGSSDTCDFESEPSFRNNPRRSPIDDSINELTRQSDKRLHEKGVTAASSVNWGELDAELAAASVYDKRGSVWKRKRLPHSNSNSDVMKLFTRPTLRNHRHQTRRGPKGFAVLAEGFLPCTVQELRLVFHMTAPVMYRDLMRCVYRRDFVHGELLRSIQIKVGDENLAKAAEHRDLFVKTASFESGNVFSTNELWNFLELLQPRDRTKDEPSARKTFTASSSVNSSISPPSFTRTLVTIDPSKVVIDSKAPTPPLLKQYVPNVVINYSFEEDPSGRMTRVVYHGEYFPPTTDNAYKRAGHERRLARLWILRLAANCHRFNLIVRRRRLGMQVIINSSKLPVAAIANVLSCACCHTTFSKFFKRTRKRLCCLCGFLVCDKCAHVQEREHQALGDVLPHIEKVRVCERCLIRVDDAQYTAVTIQDLRPARVLSNISTTLSDSSSSLSGTKVETRPTSLNDLLLEILANVTAGGEAQLKRKASVLSVMKDIVEEERARRRSDAAWIHHASVSLLGEEVEKHKISSPKLDYQLGNADSRNYQIEFPVNPIEPIIPPIPSNEFKRLKLIREQQLHELGNVPELGIICSLASKELDCSISMITIVDKAQMHILASSDPAIPSGLSVPRDQAICSQTILTPKPLVCRHLQADIRFSAIPIVRETGINYYCGFPLLGSDGKTVIGSVCCADTQARDLTRSQYDAMRSLASTASRVVQRTAERRRP